MEQFSIIFISNILNKEKIKMADKKTTTRILKPQLLDKVEEFDNNMSFTFTWEEMTACYKERKNWERNFNSPFLKMLIAKGK